VQPKLVSGENIAQTAQFVQTGNVDAGIVGVISVRGSIVTLVDRNGRVMARSRESEKFIGVPFGTPWEPTNVPRTFLRKEADGVERVELVEPRDTVQAEGAFTELLSLTPGEIQSTDHDIYPAGRFRISAPTFVRMYK